MACASGTYEVYNVLRVLTCSQILYAESNL